MKELDLNKIICGDNIQITKEFPEKIIDLTITSPPYDSIRKYKNNIKNRDKYDGFSFDFYNIADELFRITKDNGTVVWVVGDAVIDGSESGNSFRQALYFKNIGFRLHDTMIYEKNTSSFPAHKKGIRYTQIFEYMFVFSKGKPKTVNLICDKKNKWAGWTNWGNNTIRGKDNELKNVPDIKPVPDYSPRNNIWKYVVGGGFSTKDKEAHKHPAIFPEKLVHDHIISWSNEGDLIFDPFVGSGTTCKIAMLNNRNYIGIDNSREYCDIAISRIDKFFENF